MDIMQRYNQLILLCAEAKHSGRPIEPAKLNILKQVKEDLDSELTEEIENTSMYKRLKYIFDNGEYI